VLRRRRCRRDQLGTSSLDRLFARDALAFGRGSAVGVDLRTAAVGV
jgi:hypothetical protein